VEGSYFRVIVACRPKVSFGLMAAPAAEIMNGSLYVPVNIFPAAPLIPHNNFENLHMNICAVDLLYKFNNLIKKI
jgi:hypothetical protein